MNTARFLFAVLVGLGTFGATPAPSIARDATPMVSASSHQSEYRVEYRHRHHHNHHPRWRHYGTYDCYEDALSAAQDLRHRGYEVIIR